MIIEAITPPPRRERDDDFVELEDDDAERIHLVALPKIGGGYVYVKPFDKRSSTGASERPSNKRRTCGHRQ